MTGGILRGEVVFTDGSSQLVELYSYGREVDRIEVDGRALTSVVPCRSCKHHESGVCKVRPASWYEVGPDDYCSKGES